MSMDQFLSDVNCLTSGKTMRPRSRRNEACHQVPNTATKETLPAAILCHLSQANHRTPLSNTLNDLADCVRLDWPSGWPWSQTTPYASPDLICTLHELLDVYASLLYETRASHSRPGLHRNTISFYTTQNGGKSLTNHTPSCLSSVVG